MQVLINDVAELFVDALMADDTISHFFKSAIYLLTPTLTLYGARYLLHPQNRQKHILFIYPDDRTSNDGYSGGSDKHETNMMRQSHKGHNRSGTVGPVSLWSTLNLFGAR